MDLPLSRSPGPSDFHRAGTVINGRSGAWTLPMYDERDRPVAVVKNVSLHRLDRTRELEEEARGADWLSGSGIPVPRVLGHDRSRDPGFRWLVLSYLPGIPAHEPEAAREHPRLVELLAEAARTLHETSVSRTARLGTLETDMERALERVVSGVVRRSWRDTERAGASPTRALAELERRVEQAGRLPEVVTHGDFCLSHVLFEPDGEWGVVDLDRAGLGDPHRDLAAMVGSLRDVRNPRFGEADVERFLDAYGRERVDPELLALHCEVDAFFWPEPAEWADRLVRPAKPRGRFR